MNSEKYIIYYRRYSFNFSFQPARSITFLKTSSTCMIDSPECNTVLFDFNINISYITTTIAQGKPGEHNSVTLSLAHCIVCSMTAGNDLRVQCGTSSSGGSRCGQEKNQSQTSMTPSCTLTKPAPTSFSGSPTSLASVGRKDQRPWKRG